MRQKIFLIFALSLISGVFSALSAQIPETGAKPSVATGDVASLGDNKIVLQTANGTVDVLLSAKTEFKRVPPENPSLKAAVASNLSDIGVGDRLVVTGVFAADKKSVPAKSVYLMTKADISQKQSKESEQWRERGVAGKVTAINPQTNQITIEVRGLANTSSVVITPKTDAKFRRYAPNSVKYSESVISSMADVKPGDMLRARGDKAADGATFTAEEILTGAFQTVAGTIKIVDAAKGEIVISDFQTKKDITVTVGSSSVLKKFPEEMAQRMAQFQTAGGRPVGQSGQGGMRPLQGSAQPNPERENASGRGAGMRAGQGGIDDMLERFPNISVADLKTGDMIAISSTKSADTNRVTAIKLLAGVEPFLKAAQATSGQTGQRGGQGGQGSFSIPGLDGADFP